MDLPFLLVGLLNADDPRHMYILHHIFKPRINHAIESFVKGWNKHPLRTEHNWSPEKVWSNGMMDIRNRDKRQVAEVQEGATAEDDLTWFGFDPYAPSPTEYETSQVDLDDVECQLEQEQLQRLNHIDVYRVSNSFGIDIFEEALQVVVNL